ncbi:MAG: iron-sulfur cluster assembly protein, partial [Verrucomicrobiota bacterium]
MESGSESPVKLSRDIVAIQIPAGTEVTLAEGTDAVVTQSLGGSYTIAAQGGLYKIQSQDADALGLEAPATVESTAVDSGDPLEDQIWAALAQCYDPEIPVNIVDLGLIYSMDLSDGRVEVKMTLTAPGCGMGPAIAADAKSKVEALNGVNNAEVEVVWEPQWNPSMISPAGKDKLG